MIKINKIKAIALFIIFALSIILIVVGVTMNNQDQDQTPYNPDSSNYEKVYANQSFSTYTDSQNYTVEFTPSVTGYYTIYIDGAMFTKVIDNNASSSLSYDSTNVYHNSTYYDYKYRVYLYKNTKYQLKTNSANNHYIKIYVTR